jgi:hypothetical protein
MQKRYTFKINIKDPSRSYFTNDDRPANAQYRFKLKNFTSQSTNKIPSTPKTDLIKNLIDTLFDNV